MYRCPKPLAWQRVHRALREFHQRSGMDTDQAPPEPHFFGGWALAAIRTKHERWAETVRWARQHGAAHLVETVPASEFEVWIGDRPLQSLQAR